MFINNVEFVNDGNEPLNPADDIIIKHEHIENDTLENRRLRKSWS